MARTDASLRIQHSILTNHEASVPEHATEHLQTYVATLSSSIAWLAIAALRIRYVAMMDTKATPASSHGEAACPSCAPSTGGRIGESYTQRSRVLLAQRFDFISEVHSLIEARPDSDHSCCTYAQRGVAACNRMRAPWAWMKEATESHRWTGMTRRCKVRHARAGCTATRCKARRVV